MKKLPIVLVLDNIRSIYNVGSIFRTAEAVHIEKIILCGITPYPKIKQDKRLPHIVTKVSNAIAKTALGAETLVHFEYYKDVKKIISTLSRDGYTIYALEQTKLAKNIFTFKPSFPLVLVVGHEKTGVASSVLKQADAALQIPMHGQKESLNVAVATGIALYILTRNLD